MRLVAVYATKEYFGKLQFLYDLLAEREPDVNISHKRMPTFKKHRAFIESRPYKGWYLIYVNDRPVGSVYLTYRYELGVHISKKHQGNGYGPEAIRMMMEKFPNHRYLANINPNNHRSAKVFQDMGFYLVQHTYALEIPDGPENESYSRSPMGRQGIDETDSVSEAGTVHRKPDVVCTVVRKPRLRRTDNLGH